MRLKPWKFIVVMLVAIFILPPFAATYEAIAQNAKPAAEAKKIRDFTRLSFKWPKPVYLTAESEGNKVIIRFEKPASADIVNAAQAFSGVVQSHSLSADGQTLTLILNGNYRVRSFVSGNTNGVDLMPVSAATAVAKASPPPVKQAPPVAAKPQPKTPDFKPLKQAGEPKSYPIAKNKTKAINEEKNYAQLEPAAAPKEPEKVITVVEPNTPAEKVTADLNRQESVASAPPPETPAEVAPAPSEAVEKSPAVEKAAPAQTLKKRMTDAEALAEMNKTKAAEEAQHQAAESNNAVSKMTDAQAIEYRNKQMKEEAEATAGPTATPVIKRVDTPAAETKEAKEPVKATEATPVAKKPEEKPATPEPELTKSVVATPPGPEKNQAEKEEVIAPATAESVPASEEQTASGEPKIEVPSVTSAEEAATDAQTEPATPIESTSAMQDAATQGENGFRVRASLDNEILSMTFPWLERTAAAAFVRDGTAWIVFSTAAKLDLTEANSLLRAGATITQLPIAGATVLHMPVTIGAGLRVKSVEGTFKWVVQLMPARQASKEPLQVTISTEPPLKPHIFLPLLEAGKVVQITDPIIGDVMDVLPVFAEDVGISPGRSFVDFALLETSQGVAVQRFSDSTEVTVVRNGVRISTEKGAIITPGLPPVEEVQKASVEQVDTVFLPYKDWQPPEGKDYLEEIKRLEKTLISEESKNDLDTHLNIAKLYLAQGSSAETLGYLNNIKRIDPQYYIDKKLSALHGAANFLMQRYSDAAQDFSVPEVKDLKEAEFWQNMLSELLGNPNKQFSYEENYEPYIKEYPPIFRQRIGIIAADRAIAAKEYNAALKIFDQMNEHKLINEVADYINYLMGKIALETQQPEDGYKLWNALLEGKGSEFVKVRTEFSLIIEQMRRNEIAQEEAVNRLERLAIRWRGDNLELAVLTALSDIYRNNKDWPNAIRIARALNEAFPNTVAAVEAARNMDDAFIAMFDKGETGNLSTLDLLFIYHEYRDLIPQDEVGDRIVDNLTNKMLELDMLDQAETILEQRMRYRFEHQTRSKVGAKLAHIYLMDKKPEKALEALQLSVFGMLPEALLKERTYLTAEALLQLHRYEELDLLLGDDESAQANAFRLQAFWQQKDWQKVSEFGESMLQGRADPSAELSEIEQDVVVKLALSYVAQEESQQLSYMRDYFLPLMQGKKNEAVFEYLTRPYVKLTTTNFEDVMNSLQNAHNFLESWPKPEPAPATPAPAAPPEANPNNAP